MKVTLDLNKLLDEGNITQEEYIKFNGFAVVTTASLAFNILIGFGVIAVSGAALALVPAASTAILIDRIDYFSYWATPLTWQFGAMGATC